MTTLASDDMGLVSGGNIAAPNRTGTRTQVVVFDVARVLLLAGLLATFVGAVCQDLQNGYSTWATKIEASASGFVGALTSQQVFTFSPLLTQLLCYGGIMLTILAAIAMELAFRSKNASVTATWFLLMVLMLTILQLVAFILVATVGLFAGWGNHPEPAQVRAAANAWAAEHVNTRTGVYNVNFDGTYGYDPVYLRSLNPDGTLDKVYEIVTTNRSVSITPR